jgi:hypothetical protein
MWNNTPEPDLVLAYLLAVQPEERKTTGNVARLP